MQNGDKGLERPAGYSNETVSERNNRSGTFGASRDALSATIFHFGRPRNLPRARAYNRSSAIGTPPED